MFLISSISSSVNSLEERGYKYWNHSIQYTVNSALNNFKHQLISRLNSFEWNHDACTYYVYYVPDKAAACKQTPINTFRFLIW